MDGFLGAEEAHHPVAIAPIGDEALVGEGRIEDGIDLLHGDKIATLGDLDFVVEKAIGGDLVPDQVCRGFCAGACACVRIEGGCRLLVPVPGARRLGLLWIGAWGLP